MSPPKKSTIVYVPGATQLPYRKDSVVMLHLYRSILLPIMVCMGVRMKKPIHYYQKTTEAVTMGDSNARRNQWERGTRRRITCQYA
jgi:hypothetical protein